MDEWAAAAAARQGFNALGRIWVVPPDRYTLDRVIRSCSRRYVFITSSTLSARNNTAPHYSLCIRAVSACVHGCMQRFPCLWDHDTNQTRIDKEIRFNESWIRWYTTIDKRRDFRFNGKWNNSWGTTITRFFSLVIIRRDVHLCRYISLQGGIQKEYVTTSFQRVSEISQIRYLKSFPREETNRSLVSRRKNTYIYIHGEINSYTSYFSPHSICRAIASSEIHISYTRSGHIITLWRVRI